jgi:hypothetical protein
LVNILPLLDALLFVPLLAGAELLTPPPVDCVVAHPEKYSAKTSIIIAVIVFIKSPCCEINRFLPKLKPFHLKIRQTEYHNTMWAPSQKLTWNLPVGHYVTKTNQNQSMGIKI